MWKTLLKLKAVGREPFSASQSFNRHPQCGLLSPIFFFFAVFTASASSCGDMDA